ncbi:MAG: hypothetical protein P8Y13_05970 [Deinococcales bacterium]
MKRLPWQATAGLVLVGALTVAIFSSGPGPSPDGGTSAGPGGPYDMPAVNVRANCERVVKMHQILPWSVRVVTPRPDPVPVSSTGWTYDFQIDSRNGIGAMVRSAWHCRVRGRNVTARPVPSP